MKNNLQAQVKTLGETPHSLAKFKIIALLAFLLANFLSYSAFSRESAVKTTLTEQAEAMDTPVCEFIPEGFVENKWKGMRIQAGDSIVAGVESLSDLSHQLKKLVIEHKCLPLPVSCRFVSEGLAMGYWVKHRILVGDIVSFGANNTDQLFAELGELKKLGVCE
jgi:hypothetical protein